MRQTEEKELTEDQLLDEDNPCGNPYHAASSGEFVDPDEEKGSYARELVGRSCPNTGQYSRAKGQKEPGSSTAVCGRKDRHKKCSGEKVVERRFSLPEASTSRPNKVTHTDIAQLIRERLTAPHRSLQSRSPSQLREAVKKGVQTYCQKHGFRSLESFLKLLNTIDLAKSGDLFKQKG